MRQALPIATPHIHTIENSAIDYSAVTTSPVDPTPSYAASSAKAYDTANSRVRLFYGGKVRNSYFNSTFLN